MNPTAWQRLLIAKEFGDKSAERRAHCNLGNAHIFLGQFEVAAGHYKWVTCFSLADNCLKEFDSLAHLDFYIFNYVLCLNLSSEALISLVRGLFQHFYALDINKGRKEKSR